MKCENCTPNLGCGPGSNLVLKVRGLDHSQFNYDYSEIPACLPSQRNKNQRMQDSVAAAQLDDDGNLDKKYQQPLKPARSRPRPRAKKAKSTGAGDAENTTSDSNFEGSESSESEVSDDSGNVSNAEVSSQL